MITFKRILIGPRTLFTACILALLSGAVHAAPAETLGPGDSVRVLVYQNPDLTTETRVTGQGAIILPLVGAVDVDGLTPVEAGEAIAGELSAGRFLVDPQVTVSILEVRSRQVSVLGHVGRPGQYPLDGGPRTLTDVLAMAGGISENGDDTVIVVTARDGESKTLEIDVPAMYQTGDMSSNIVLHTGDTIFVPAAKVFYVYGEVRRAGSYRLRPQTSVLDALSLGGGLTPRGTDSGIRIHRTMSDGTVAMLEAELSDPVEADDVIHVRESLF